MTSGSVPEMPGLDLSDNDLAKFIFHLFKLGLDTAEIAEVLHISEAKAYNLLSEVRGYK